MIDKCNVSIVIAIYNGSETIEECLHSIKNQTYPNIEIIVIDGGSQDGTLDILKENSGLITHWESKKDNGIYDAWNKALKHVSGDWVCFLGADDKFYYPDAIQDMLNVPNLSSTNYISAKMEVDLKGGMVIKGEPWSKKAMQKRQDVAHPGSLHHYSLFKKNGNFDESYKIAGDYDFLLRSENCIRAQFIDRVTVLMGGDGVSNVRVLPVFMETFTIQRKNKEIGLIKAVYNFSIAVFKTVVRKFYLLIYPIIISNR